MTDFFIAFKIPFLFLFSYTERIEEGWDFGCLFACSNTGLKLFAWSEILLLSISRPKHMFSLAGMRDYRSSEIHTINQF